MRRENIAKYEGRKRGRKRSRERNIRGSKNGGRGWVDGEGCSTATLFIQVECQGSC